MYSRVKRNQMNKVNKYSIRKSSFGAVSVAVAALMVFGAYSGVSADEQKVDSHRTEKEEQKVSEKLERMTRKEANKAAALVGGIPEKGVTKHTNILVVGEQDWRVVGTDGLSSKMKKAQTLLEKGQDIEIMTENDFIRLLEE